MSSRSRRSVSRPCYTEPDSFSETLPGVCVPDSSPEKSASVKRRGRPRKSVVSSGIGSDQDDVAGSQFKIVKNAYPKIVLGDENFKFEKQTSRSAPVTPRRSIRPKRKSCVFREAEETANCLKKLVVKSDNDDDEDDDDSDYATPLEKQTSLFTDEDVEGKKIFGFKMNHRKKSLLKKAIESVLETPKKLDRNSSVYQVGNSPRTPKSTLKSSNPNTPRSTKRVSIHATSSTSFTPKNLKFSDNQEKTPYKLRQKIKKKLQTLTLTDEEISDFSGSDSDFCPSESSEDDDIIENDDVLSDVSNESSGSTEDVCKSVSKKEIRNKTTTKSYSLRKRGGKDPDFLIKSDNYFHMHGNKKVVTSNHTLERLKNPRFTEEKLHNILKDQIISAEHKCAIKEILEDHKKLFDKWLYFLSEGFNILLYGVGSKEKLIQEFQKERLSTYPCIVINGYFPILTLKDILESIGSDLLGISTIPANPYEAVEIIENEMAEISENVFLLVHNLDGALLRNHKSQHVLSKLAKIHNLHVIASIDHINAPLFWDHAKLSNYNFSWWDATTFVPYTNETSYESSLLVHKSGIIALSSLKNVYHSLTSNAKGIYLILVKNQLKNTKTPHYQGISFKDLYWSAREAFLVSSDLALRAQLTEFLDHKLVKNKRTVDGTENLIIPIDNNILQHFVEQIEES